MAGWPARLCWLAVTSNFLSNSGAGINLYIRPRNRDTSPNPSTTLTPGVYFQANANERWSYDWVIKSTGGATLASLDTTYRFVISLDSDPADNVATFFCYDAVQTTIALYFDHCFYQTVPETSSTCTKATSQGDYNTKLADSSYNSLWQSWQHSFTGASQFPPYPTAGIPRSAGRYEVVLSAINRNTNVIVAQTSASFIVGRGDVSAQSFTPTSQILALNNIYMGNE